MKTELTPEDLAKAIQFLKDNSIREDEVCLNRLVGWINAPRTDQSLIDKGNRIYPLSDLETYRKEKKEWQESKLLNPKAGYTYHDGVNTHTYRGNGVWTKTLLHDCREFKETTNEKT